MPRNFRVASPKAIKERVAVSHAQLTSHRTTRFTLYTFASVIVALLASSATSAQVGRRAVPTSERAALLNVSVTRGDGVSAPISAADITLYDDGVEQRIQSFVPDSSPARIVILADNSLTLRTEADKLREAVREFAYEIYEGDQILTIGYDEQAEIIQDWTDDAKALEKSLSLIRKKGEPRLLDAFDAVIEQALRPLSGGVTKRAVILIGDGLDRGSKATFNKTLAELQRQDVTVYALQLPDRTGGAHKRNVPKPSKLIQQIVEGTGGQIFSLDDTRAAAQTICDELRKKRYVLAYNPTNPSLLESRRLLIVGGDGIEVRYKLQQPAR